MPRDYGHGKQKPMKKKPTSEEPAAAEKPKKKAAAAADGVKKTIKKSVKKAIKELWSKAKEEESLPEELDFLLEAISQATGMTVDEVEQMDTYDFLYLTASIGES